MWAGPVVRPSGVVVRNAGFGAPPKAKKKKKTGKPKDARCPCHSGAALEDCCGPVLDGRAAAATASALLRARYSAFVRKDVDFIMASTHESSHEDDVEAWRRKIAKGLDQTRFTSLALGEEVPIDDTSVDIVFEAGMQPVSQRGQGAKAILVTERARFVRDDASWFYVNGTDINAETAKGAAPVSRPAQES